MRFAPEWWAFWAGVWAVALTAAAALAGIASWYFSGVVAEETGARARAMELTIAEQQERAANAERSLLELQERLANRRLSDAQRAALIETLREAPGEIRVACAADRPEPCAFAGVLVDALTVSGWTVTEFNRNAIFVGGPAGDLAIHVNNAVNPPPRAGVLQAALRAAGFESVGSVDATLPDGVVALLVKHKL